MTAATRNVSRALLPELSMLLSLNYWLRSARRRDWSFLRELAFDNGLKAHSLLPAVSPSHFASFSNAFLKEAGMHLKQPESLPYPGQALEALGHSQSTGTEKEARGRQSAALTALSRKAQSTSAESRLPGKVVRGFWEEKSYSVLTSPW